MDLISSQEHAEDVVLGDESRLVFVVGGEHLSELVIFK